MSERPLRLLDIFCGAGGCSVGYARAGFEVYGVDNRPMPRYPFGFMQDDALDVLRHLVGGWSIGPFLPSGKRFWLRDLDAIHASPPCQAYSWASARHRNAGVEYPDLLEPTRELLEKSGKPWVIENVPGAPFDSAITLCGLMFGLRVYRHRSFEASFVLLSPRHPHHRERCAPVGCAPKNNEFITVAGHFGKLSRASAAMGIDWMSRQELSQAIPPAYTEYVGRQLADHCRHRIEEALR